MRVSNIQEMMNFKRILRGTWWHRPLLEISTDQELYTFTLEFQNETTGPIHVGVFELNEGLTVESVVNRSNWDNLNNFFK